MEGSDSFPVLKLRYSEALGSVLLVELAMDEESKGAGYWHSEVSGVVAEEQGAGHSSGFIFWMESS